MQYEELPYPSHLPWQRGFHASGKIRAAVILSLAGGRKKTAPVLRGPGRQN